MADQWSGGQSGPGERWNVNLPAVIGVVFVFLVGVIVWVIAASGDDDGQVTIGSSIPSALSTTLPAAPIQTTTPPPMPSTSIVVPTPPPATAPATVPATAPATAAPAPALPAPALPAPALPAPAPTPAPTVAAAPTAAPTTVTPQPPTPPSGGDLGVPGHPMQHPPCDGGYITVLASAIGDEATAGGMDSVLDDFGGSSYLRTDESCSSLTPSEDGEPIYVVYFGPFPTDSQACDARSDGPDDAYVRRLSNDLSPGHSVSCS